MASRLRRTAAALVVTFLAAVTVPVAGAIPEPDMDSITATPPSGDDPRPEIPMRQTAECAVSTSLEDSSYDQLPPASTAFQVPRLHQFATGKGVKVAVIDSGVAPNPRLPRLEGGGDYVMGGDGLEDCDHHGTLIAGIIGAQPSEEDGFIGVAPDVDLISIRQTSGAFGPENPEDGRSASTLATLAASVVRATDLGAQVINMSVTSCFPADRLVDTTDVAAALKYAYDRGVVVVASAGNADASACASNPQYDPSNPTDARNWKGVTNVSMPSFYTPALISVGGTSLTGSPYPNTMAGPWVDVAAPAVSIVSLDPDGNGSLTNASKTDDGPAPLNGTSFAAAYVSGLAALILEKYPDLTPDEVATRITATAMTGSSTMVNTLGHGNVDPVAALTATDVTYAKVATSEAAEEREPVAPTFTAPVVSAIVIGSLCVVMVILALLVTLIKRLSANSTTVREETYDVN